MGMDDRSSMDLLRGSRIIAYTIGALALIAGIVLLFWPDRTITVVARVVGILILVVGFGQAIEAVTTHRKGSYWGLLLLRGVVNLVAGALLLFWPSITVTVIVWLLGIELVLSGILGLIASTQVPKDMGKSGIVVQALVAIVLGIIIMVWPSATLTVMAVLGAIVLIVLGVMFLVSGFQLSKTRVEVV
ncbi:MAG: DUF308 domain-containing protein [Acidimicrobiales bacterium]|jgi:uncharacterized membrane protein HdeD (DUF308 family)|nr:DUF308 domain-containing protein [Acidimicrobiales bacterium]